MMLAAAVVPSTSVAHEKSPVRSADVGCVKSPPGPAVVDVNVTVGPLDVPVTPKVPESPVTYTARLAALLASRDATEPPDVVSTPIAKLVLPAVVEPDPYGLIPGSTFETLLETSV
jgi:hypothetical protein